MFLHPHELCSMADDMNIMYDIGHSGIAWVGRWKLRLHSTFVYYQNLHCVDDLFLERSCEERQICSEQLLY